MIFTLVCPGSRCLLTVTTSLTMSLSPALPPLDGSISVLPGFVDFHAKHNADLPWALLSAGPELPVQSVSFAQYAGATHRVAHLLRPERVGKDKDVVAILVNCDTIVYLALIAGLVRAGLVVRDFFFQY